ncbi:hypothetical protein [Deinococcus ruber]|uniref:hypothetical protein n=1 Tax=Deinococcus ruber TaxID=1848197 RepID=UPI00166A30E0|nr:hypothetical protein [Deinococcus ruber]
MTPFLDVQVQQVATSFPLSEAHARALVLQLLRTWDTATLRALRIERAQLDTRQLPPDFAQGR